MDNITTQRDPQIVRKKKKYFYRYLIFLGVAIIITAATFFIVRDNSSWNTEVPYCYDKFRGIPWQYSGTTYFVQEDGTQSVYQGETFNHQNCLAYRHFLPIVVAAFALDAIFFFVVIVLGDLVLKLVQRLRRKSGKLEPLEIEKPKGE
jgi:hypothetical protein